MLSFSRTIVVIAVVLHISMSVAGQRPQDPAPPYPYYEEEVRFQNKKDRIELAGSLTLPLTKGPFPAVVLSTGAGPQDRDETAYGHKPFRVLAHHLTRLGIAVLRVDDRGVGKSTGNFSEATSEDFATDALAGIEYLKSRKEIARDKIGLVGHCEGGLVGPIAAARSKDVAFLVLMAGPGLRGDQVVLGPGGLDREDGWLSDELFRRNRRTQEIIFGIIKEEKDPAVAEIRIRREAEVFREIATTIKERAPESYKAVATKIAAAIEGQTKLFLSPWFRFYFAYDPRSSLMKVKCPVLAINGETDTQVPPKENLEAIREALEAGGNKDFTVRMLPNLNHLLQNSDTGAISEYEYIEETLSPLALETVSNWILQHTSRYR